MTRYLLLVIATGAGTYALASWICGLLTDAGIAGAISAAAVLVAEWIAYSQRGRMRRGREQVWERRERYTTDDLFAAHRRLWDERRPVEKFMVYDHGEPVAGFNSQGIGGVWDFSTGAPE